MRALTYDGAAHGAFLLIFVLYVGSPAAGSTFPFWISLLLRLLMSRVVLYSLLRLLVHADAYPPPPSTRYY